MSCSVNVPLENVVLCNIRFTSLAIAILDSVVQNRQNKGSALSS